MFIFKRYSRNLQKKFKKQHKNPSGKWDYWKIWGASATSVLSYFELYYYICMQHMHMYISYICACKTMDIYIYIQSYLYQ